MKNSILMVFLSLSAYVLMANAQMSTPWTNPYFYYHYNAPLPPQKTSTDEMDGNIKHHLSDYGDQIISDSLGAHSFLISTCVRELRTTKADLAQTTQRLNDSYTEIESIKDELKGNSQMLTNVMETVENLKNIMNATKADLAQRFNDTYSEVETIKVELKGNSQLMKNFTDKHENLTKVVNARTSDIAEIGKMPTSCSDLQRIGNKKNGFFSVMGQNKIQTVYCNFTKLQTDQNFQSLIGYNDVKSSQVYFHAQKTMPHTTINTVIPFDMFRSNVGNAINSTGVFVAPRSGTYFFSFSAISGSTFGRVELQMKNATSDWFKIGQAYGPPNVETLTLQSTLQLAKSDQIRCWLREGAIYDENTLQTGLWTHFVGFLLEEDIF